MSAHIKRLQPKQQQETQQRIEQLQLILSQCPELQEQEISSIVWKIKRKNNLQELNKWTFIMISPEQNLTVVNWLDDNSTQPRKAVRLWALLFDNVQRETGQIMLTRQEIANKISIKPCHVSTIMSELAKIGAILKKKDGRGVIYYMNPNVANHYPQEIREEKQKEAPQLKLLDGGLN